MTDIVKTRTPPTIVTHGKRTFISSGRMYLPYVVDHVTSHGSDDWLQLKDLAKFVYGNSFKDSTDRVRAAIWRIRKEALNRALIVIDEGRPVERIKIANMRDANDRLSAEHVLRRMKTRREFSAEQYEKAYRIVYLEHHAES